MMAQPRKPMKPPNRRSLREFLSRVTPKNLRREVNSGSPVGREAL